MNRKWASSALAIVIGLGAYALAACGTPPNDATSGQGPLASGEGQLPDGEPVALDLFPGEHALGTVDGLIVIANRGDQPRSIRLVDATAGTQIWSSEDRFGGAAVHALAMESGILIVELRRPSADPIVAGVTPEAGEILWTLPVQRQQFTAVPGTGTGIIRTDSVPVVVSAQTGDEIWRAEPGDKMKTALGTAQITDASGRKSYIKLADGALVRGRPALADSATKSATSAGFDTWASGRGAWKSNGDVRWGKPKAMSSQAAGDGTLIATIMRAPAGWQVTTHRTESGEDMDSTEVATCRNGQPVGFTNGVLVWTCPTADKTQLQSLRLA
jgi:hypothetical protein